MNPLWNLTLVGEDYKEETVNRTLFTLANGYRSLLGGNEFSPSHRVVSLIAGIFDRSKAQVPELVVAPNPLDLRMYAMDSRNMEQIQLSPCQAKDYRRVLDLRQGILETQMTMVTPEGKQTRIQSQRFVSKANRHRWAATYSVTPLNWDGFMIVDAGINGHVFNNLTDPIHRCSHLQVKKTRDWNPGISLLAETRDQAIQILETLSVHFPSPDRSSIQREYRDFPDEARDVHIMECAKQANFSFCLLGTTFTSKDLDSHSLSIWDMARHESMAFQKDGWEGECSAHRREWDKFWEKTDIELEGDDPIQQGIRWNLFQLGSCAPTDPSVSIAAKGLHGEGYKGHVFWDTETFIFPFFLMTQPEVARNLLLYRWNMLSGAVKNAQSNGFEGAQYPWESTDTGEETTPSWGRNYKGQPMRIWTGDEEIHITGDIAIAIMQYYRATDDTEFMEMHGVEILIQTARFWASRLEWNPDSSRYEIRNVIGPDEFHEHVDNNVFTNELARWNLNAAAEMVQWLKDRNPKLLQRIEQKVSLPPDLPSIWREKASQIYLPMDSTMGIIEQFEGYFQKRHDPITAWDEGGLPCWPNGVNTARLNDTQLIKQPDVLMLFHILPHLFSYETVQRTYDFYESRTMHKSSLSPCIHSILGIRVGNTTHAYDYFAKTIFTDLKDLQGNAADGLHAACTGGAWQAAVFGFGGLSIDPDGIPHIQPWIPKHWKKLTYRFTWKGVCCTVSISHKEITGIASGSTRIRVLNQEKTVTPGELWSAG